MHIRLDSRHCRLSTACMPDLIAWFSRPDGSPTIHHIRELSPEQFGEFSKHKSEYALLNQRCSLLHILELNFSSLIEYADTLCTSAQSDPLEGLQLNRHFMNYLASSYALREHLETSIVRDRGRNSEAVMKFRKFLALLEERHFSYAFFQDFRNYVQHCGFPIGRITRSLHAQGVKLLKVVHDKNELLRRYNRWDKCHLKERPSSTIDLLATARAHQKIMVAEFPSVILAEYGSNINNIASYFDNLNREAKQINPNAVAKVVLSFERHQDGGKFTLDDIPLNPFAQLGFVKPNEMS